MLLSGRWLKDYTNPGVSQKIFMDAMTASGSKVEGFSTEGEELENIVVGKIQKLERHPNSDRLWICSVDIGKSEPIVIVTGAQNLKIGDYVPVALDNSTVFGGKKIKKDFLRGVESAGMLCSLEELGLTLHDFPYAISDGIFVLGDDCDKTLGKDIREAIGLNDVVTEFEITPNRPDCLSVFGLAREAAATFEKKLKAPKTDLVSTSGYVNELLSVSIEAPNKCFRYCGAVVNNVRIKPSPLWMRERLRASGVRAINNIVDITNFVMLEMGQPMHAFDLKFVEGSSIIVRCAREGEAIITLDGISRPLDSSMLVIADNNKPIAVAGVMGGEFSGIMDDSATIVFESACFDDVSVRKTSKKLGLRTESSSRFEKGLDRELCDTALRRALVLVQQLDAGDVVGGIIDCYPRKKETTVIPFKPDWTNRFIGIDVSKTEQINILEKLQFKIENDRIYVPSFREDVKHLADISEEIARYYGYENIPDRELSGKADGRLTEKQLFERKINELMVSLGACEVLTYSFLSPKAYDKILLPSDSKKRNSVIITNPLGEDTSVMRTTPLPSILDVLSRNFNNRNSEAFVYELSTVYIPRGNDALPDEAQVLTAGMYSSKANYYLLKGIVEELLNQLGIENVSFNALADNPSYHPGRTAVISVKGEEIGIIGEIHPNVLVNYEIGMRCYAFEISFDALFKNALKTKTYKPLPKFPAATRDLALVCDKSIPVAKLSNIIKKAIGNQLEEIKLFDIYEGSQIPEDKKSVAFSLTMRSSDKTLTDAQADEAIKNALKELEIIGATLRI